MATRAQRRQATQNRIKAISSQLRAEAFRVIRDRGPISPKEVALELEVEVSDLNYHIRKLEEFNCIEEVSSRQVGTFLQHFYVATEQHMVDTEEWDELAEVEPEMAEFLVDEYMQSIVDDYTESRRADVVGLDGEFFIVRHPLRFDPEGIKEALEASEEYESKLLDIATRSIERRGRESTEAVPVSASVVFFKMPRRTK